MPRLSAARVKGGRPQPLSHFSRRAYIAFRADAGCSKIRASARSDSTAVAAIVSILAFTRTAPMLTMPSSPGVKTPSQPSLSRL